jgi:hypothetical protein
LAVPVGGGIMMLNLIVYIRALREGKAPKNS